MAKTAAAPMTAEERKVIFASSLGTVFEWYDFYLYGSLAAVIAKQFFAGLDAGSAFIFALLAFAAGFIVRPFGALLFGRLGDMIGRKYTFLVTILIMGGATFIVGILPNYNTIGVAAPVILIALRMLQGLALGGEYGGAATYVAEHAPAGKRGAYTAWIQTTATVGLFVSLMVILITKSSLSKEAFENWGWRVPFWVSILMVAVSYLIRKKMHESPVFQKAKDEGKVSKNPLKESFGNRYNFKFVLLALFGVAMGQGVVWYTGQFYAMSFLKTVMSIDSNQVDTLLGISLLIGTPFFVFFGWLSDKIGRKKIMLAGMLFAIILYRPIYKAMYERTNVKNKTEVSSVLTVSEAPGKKGGIDSVYVTNYVYADNTKFTEEKTVHLTDAKERIVGDDGKEKIDTKKTVLANGSDRLFLGLMVLIQVLFVTMVYGPIAAFLVELFPVQIRYTSMSLPYHIGNGIFGGLLPAIATYLVTQAKDAGQAEFYLNGLWYPIIIASVSFIIGLIYINEKKTRHQD
ncbi:MAG: hypothetical protein RLZZ384_953 [Pseudomonadota bacterium]